MSYLNKALRYLESQVRLRGGVDVSDLANTARTYTAKDGNVCAWDPGGGNVNVTMPAVTASEGLVVLFINTADAAENLVIKDAAAATIATIGQGGWAFVSSDGAVWKAANLGNQAALAAANTWALLQTFTSGIAADTVAEVTSAAGVTVDGLLIKDGSARIATVADPGTGAAIPVTASASIAITQNGSETNTLAIPTFRGQTLTLFVDTDTSGARVITSSHRINQAAQTVITMSDAGDCIKLEAITIGGALRWQVIANDGCVLS